MDFLFTEGRKDCGKKSVLFWIKSYHRTGWALPGEIRVLQDV